MNDAPTVMVAPPGLAAPQVPLWQAGDGPAAPPPAPRGDVSGRTASRVVIWAALTSCLCILVASAQPLALALAVLSMSALCAVALAPNRGADPLSVTAFVPGGFVLTVASALVWGLAGGAAGIGAWSTRTASLIGLGLLVGTTGAISWRRGGRVVVVGRDAPALTGFILVSAFFTWVVITQPFAWWSRINGSGTDFLRHLSVVRAVRSDGSIQPGSPSYPKALHALVAWLANAMGLPTGADPMWRAAALAGFLMLALMLLAVMAVATRATIAISGSRTAGVLAGVVGGLVFVQTAWFSSFLAFGSVMNMLVAVCLLTLLLSGHQVGIFGSTTGTILCGACLAVTANSWQLLIPVVGLAAMPWIVQFLRLGGWRRPGDWAVWLLSAAVAFHGLLSLRGVPSAHASAVTVSNLFRPDWWWWVALALALHVIVRAARADRTAWSMTAFGLIIGAVGLTGYLLTVTHSTWDLLLYYPAKALWTAMVALIPLASAGAVTLLVGAWSWAGRRSAHLGVIVRGSTALGVGVICIGVLGRGSAFPPHLVTIAEGRAGMPNWGMALIDSMSKVPISSGTEDGAVVFGLVPSAGPDAVRGGFVGMVDYMGMEALDHVGVNGAANAPIKVAIRDRDMTAICTYLQDHPRSLRISGPNAAAGPEWIIDSGCPASVVQPNSWVVLQIDPVWFERSAWEQGDWTFPSFGESFSVARRV